MNKPEAGAFAREVKAMLAALVRVVKYADTIEIVRSGMTYRQASRMVARQGQRAKAEDWTPFVQETPLGLDALTLQSIADKQNMTPEEVMAVARDVATDTLMVNNRYRVFLRKLAGEAAIHLSINRIDQMPIHDWRDLQRIKNELVGPECEGIELYPAESRLVDTSNQYHLWCCTDPTFRWPLGMNTRLVTDDEGRHFQRPFES